MKKMKCIGVYKCLQCSGIFTTKDFGKNVACPFCFSPDFGWATDYYESMIKVADEVTTIVLHFDR